MNKHTTASRAGRARANRPSPSANRTLTADRSRLAVEWWPIERVTPYARNPRLAPEAAIAKLAVSLKEYGFRQPLVVDEAGVIVVGHTRLLAAKRLGLTTVPVHVAGDLSPAQVKAYRLADNRTAEESSWDYELLPTEIGELADLDYDIDLLGFDPEEMAAIMATPTSGLSDPDEVLSPPAEPRTKLGDLWMLGEHRLLCGDATDPEQVKRLMAGRRAVLMATDPPYLVDYDGGNHPETWANGGKRGADPAKHWDSYVDQETSVAFYEAFLRAAVAEALGKSPVVYQWFAMMRAEIVMAAWRAAALLPHQVLVWKKSRKVLGRSDYMYDYEPMLYGWISGRRPAARRRPPAKAGAVWEIASTIEDGASGLHPTQKPVETLRRCISYHTLPGETIYEPFAGSGTALVAAEELGRRCYALELSPAYVDVAVERWQRFTGREAVRRG